MEYAAILPDLTIKMENHGFVSLQKFGTAKSNHLVKAVTTDQARKIVYTNTELLKDVYKKIDKDLDYFKDDS